MNKLTSSLALILLAMTVAVCIAACGGSSSTAKDAATNSRTAFSSCLKQHGVSLKTGGFGHKKAPKGGFPSGGGSAPTGTNGAPSGAPSGGSGKFPSGGAGGFGNSKFRSAMKACESKLPASERGKFGAGFGGKHRGNFKPSFNEATLKKFVACIRDHGYKDMPEPSKTSGGGFFPKSVESNKEFKQALPKCESILRSASKPSGTSTAT